MKQKLLSINGTDLNIKKISNFVKNPRTKIILKKKTLNQAEFSHNFLNYALKEQNKIIYGINTGFGPMASYILAPEQVIDLQNNLILSHAVGMGEFIKEEFVLAAMLVRLNTLSQGYSGVSPKLLNHLQNFINLRIIPCVPEHGAVGTSGDLVQLAHIALGLIGKGKAIFNNKIQNVSEILKQTGLKPYILKPREGLALINGTSMMTGIATLICEKSNQLLSLNLSNGCLSLEVIKAYNDSYSEKLHQLRPHKGQMAIAKLLRSILHTSKLTRNREVLNKNFNHSNEVHKINESVQEFYSMRCISQILGPVYDTLANTWQVTEIEMNSVTDNPIVDWENKKFLHGGNFHGDYVAVAMDQLKMSLVKMTMLSERRLNFFLHSKINQLFPPFQNLATPGLTLGMQAIQFVATSTTANSQTLGYPMNLHSIPTNGDNQDVVSMGTDAALLTHKVLENGFVVSAIEALALCQAVDYLKIQNQLSDNSKKLYNFVRKYVPKIVADREIHEQLQTLLSKIKNWEEINLIAKF